MWRGLGCATIGATCVQFLIERKDVDYLAWFRGGTPVERARRAGARRRARHARARDGGAQRDRGPAGRYRDRGRRFPTRSAAQSAQLALAPAVGRRRRLAAAPPRARGARL